MDSFSIAREWFDIARMDFESAKYLQGMSPLPLEIICYHCQQSTEKFLKGFLAMMGHEIFKTHDLTILNKLCRNYAILFESIESECLRLTDYAVNIRYPYPLELSESDMKIALTDAATVKNFVLSKVEIILKQKK